MAVSLPTSADVRKVRSEATKAVNSQLETVKTPFLAWIGAGDLAVAKVNEAVSEARTRAAKRRELAAKRAKKLRTELGEVPGELNPDGLRSRVEDVTEQVRGIYTDLADRGEQAVERIRKQPRVKRVLETVSDVTEQTGERFEKVVDDVHDTGEEVLGRVSTETRSVGERAARATQRIAGQTADAVQDASTEVADSIDEAGDEAAHSTRSATRKAANRTAPAKPAATRRGGNGTAAK